MPARKDLSEPIWVGDTFDFPVRFLTEGARKPLGGKTVVFMLKRSPHDADDKALLTYTAVISPGDPLGDVGDHVIRLQPSETAPLPLGLLSYQVQLITPGSPEDEVTTYLWGRACCKDS